MTQKLSEFKLSEWALIVDLLGFAHTMTESVNWLNTIGDLLDTIDSSVYKSFDILNPQASIKVYQYGDTLNFFSDNPQELLLLAVILQQDLWGKNILAQMALACGGVYDLSDTDHLRRLKSLHPGLVIQALVGKAVAKGHLLLQGVKGPRIILDEECGAIPENRPAWHRLHSAASNLSDIDFHRSEVSWWHQIIDFDVDIETRMKEIESEIQHYSSGNSAGDAPNRRRIKSRTKRHEHLAELLKVVKADDRARGESYE